jgi:hypothetical protein
MNLNQRSDLQCSEIARINHVPLIGTAVQGDMWLLIEYLDRWEAKAFEQSKIPDAVKVHIEAANISKKQVRTLLIKQPKNRNHGGINFFIALPSQMNPQLFFYHLKKYEDILDIDLASIASGEFFDSSHLWLKPLYLVCTNGRRDICCSIYGPDVFRVVAEEAGDAAWQSSHIGGHNKAPVILFFPDGVNYGFANPIEARKLVKAYQNKSIVLDYYRGRVCYESHLQAAEHFWRLDTGIMDLPGLHIADVSLLNEDEWLVKIIGMDGEVSEIHLKSHISEFAIPVTCSNSKEKPITTYHRLI